MKSYKKELKSIKEHRKLYFPVLKRMSGLQKGTPSHELPVDLRDDPDILIILELIDLEYLNHEAFPVYKKFETIEHVIYNGLEALTETGDYVLLNHELTVKKRALFFLAIAVCVLICLFVLFIKTI